MANVNELLPFIAKWEGTKFTNDPVDPGGTTKLGITLDTWKRRGYDKDGDGDIDVEDVKLLDINDLKVILKSGYWDVWKADFIKSQSVSNILVDWYYNSGMWGIKIPQRLLGLKEDGNVGKLTLDAVNSQNPKEFFEKVKAARLTFYDTIISKSINEVEIKLGKQLTEQEKLKLTTKRFEKGWKARVNDLKFVD